MLKGTDVFEEERVWFEEQEDCLRLLVQWLEMDEMAWDDWRTKLKN